MCIYIYTYDIDESYYTQTVHFDFRLHDPLTISGNAESTSFNGKTPIMFKGNIS